MRPTYPGQRPKSVVKAQARDAVAGTGYRRNQRSRQSKARR